MPKQGEKTLYLTFDDGPHPIATRFALDTLKVFNAKASFFCIGKNIVAQPELYGELQQAGHSIGNHTYQHLNGWKVSSQAYLSDIDKTQQLINGSIFRPPYGRMTRRQEQTLKSKYPGLKVIMWDLLSGDFDTTVSPEKCWDNVRRFSRNGSIIVFHDSTKAFERMQYALPRTLEYFSKKGFQFRALPTGN